ncbi:urea carboxylase/cobaltochelatase CobN/diaminohydroxyphosphoribosylaminopyrimidine deaminase / 5-amino-6-(5-phosphoribosylamino)uracil reductase [Rhizobium sp. AN5]|nr:urea carboxylase/cobaltochelatase CobN/diaminohydroxyphosphoribosylaminopyrimidine deaminase / 5-amino-6-(5-phosphoribosylamino)uracil reductase [Rhizobium sp. AN5]
MLATIPPSVLPDISPSRGEIDKWHASRFISVVGDASCEVEPVPQLISPREGEMSGRTEGGKRHLLRGQTHAR